MADPSGSPLALGYLLHSGVRHVTVPLGPYRLTIDLRDPIMGTELYLRGTWEPYESELVAALLQPGQVFVDAGAHIGYYSLLAAGRVGPSGRVLAFEPGDDNFALLEQNVRRNGLEGVIRPVRAALAAAGGELDLYPNPRQSSDHRVYPTAPADDAIFTGGRSRVPVRVPAVALDEYLAAAGIPGIDAAKLDVQGAEMAVLAGMAGALHRAAAPLVFMEYWPYGLQAAGTDPAAPLRFLGEELGLALLLIRPDPRCLVPIEPRAFAAAHRATLPQGQFDVLACRDPAGLFRPAAVAGFAGTVYRLPGDGG